jgi:peptidoglycan/LPS O-acetylase OafA/YrhL
MPIQLDAKSEITGAETGAADTRSFSPAHEIKAKTVDNSNLDFLRATAVLFVVAAHVTYFFGIVRLGSWSLQPLGFWGVLIFFVHTSLVLMLSLERQWNHQGSNRLFMMFMVRRCFRIFPLSILVVILILVFHLPQANLDPGKFEGIAPTGWGVFVNLALVQNLFKKDSILGPMWSLPYEMQMYLFLPWLFLLLRPSRSTWRSLTFWLLSVAVGAFAVHHLRRIPDMALYIPCFLPGVMAYQLQRKARFRLQAFLWPLAVAALTITHLVATDWAMHWGGETRWAMRWGACLLLGLAVPRFAHLSVRWLVVASQIIAKYSYGIYLTHYFAMWLAFERLGNLPKLEKIVVFLVIGVGLPVLFYHGVEEPMIRIGKRVADRIPAFTPFRKIKLGFTE